jgi:hypothetical protein
VDEITYKPFILLKKDLSIIVRLGDMQLQVTRSKNNVSDRQDIMGRDMESHMNENTISVIYIHEHYYESIVNNNVISIEQMIKFNETEYLHI